jgi:hypothetical protein
MWFLRNIMCLVYEHTVNESHGSKFLLREHYVLKVGVRTKTRLLRHVRSYRRV